MRKAKFAAFGFVAAVVVLGTDATAQAEANAQAQATVQQQAADANQSTNSSTAPAAASWTQQRIEEKVAEIAAANQGNESSFNMALLRFFHLSMRSWHRLDDEDRNFAVYWDLMRACSDNYNQGDALPESCVLRPPGTFPY